MFRKLIVLIYVSCIFWSSAVAQDKIANFTLSVIDTSASQYEQARSIYNWITSNIRYDVKSLKSHDYTNHSPEEILARRKGVCADYARLYTAMCQSAGIECYPVPAYSKGYGYYTGKPLTHADHMINVFYTDSLWHLVDATWGSGAVYSVVPAVLQTLQKLTGGAVPAPAKIKFERLPNLYYFDISPEAYVQIQYPLDPKWLLSENPMSFIHFETDSLPLIQAYVNYNSEIEAVRHSDEYQLLKHDAENGIRFNTKNHFDLASGYHLVSLSYDIDREITESNLWQFEKYLNDYKIIILSCDRSLVISDSLYRIRNKDLRQLASANSRMESKIKKQLKSAKKSIKPETKRIQQKSESYMRKMGKYKQKSDKLANAHLNPIVLTDTLSIQNARLMGMWNDYNLLQLSIDTLNSNAGLLFAQIDSQSKNDAVTNDSVHFQNLKFEKLIYSLNEQIIKTDEDSIRYYFSELSGVYHQLAQSLAYKRKLKADMQQASKNYLSYSALLQNQMTKQISLLRGIYMMGSYPDSILKRHNLLVDSLVASYNQSYGYMRKLNNHTLQQIDYKKQILKSLKTQKKAIRRESYNFRSWYKSVSKWEEACYVSDKTRTKEMRIKAQADSRIVASKLKKYYQLHPKAS